MTYRNAASEQDRSTAVGIMRKNSVKFGVIFELLERTDRQTDILVAILRTPPGDVVIIYVYVALLDSVGFNNTRRKNTTKILQNTIWVVKWY